MKHKIELSGRTLTYSDLFGSLSFSMDLTTSGAIALDTYPYRHSRTGLYAWFLTADRARTAFLRAKAHLEAQGKGVVGVE